MIRKNDPNSDFWQHAERVSRKVDGFPPWKLGRLERMKFKKGDRVKLRTSRQKGVISDVCKGYYRVAFQDWGAAYAEEELELVPELEQKSRFALEVTDTEFIAVSTLGPYVELSINDDERLNLHPEQARRVAMMLLIAAEELDR